MARLAVAFRPDLHAGIGLALTFAPLLFVTVAVTEAVFGHRVLTAILDFLVAEPGGSELLSIASPVLLLGSLTAALGLNLFATLRVNVRRGDGVLVGTVAVQTRLWNLTVVALSGFLMATMLGYAFVENISHP